MTREELNHIKASCRTSVMMSIATVQALVAAVEEARDWIDSLETTNGILEKEINYTKRDNGILRFRITQLERGEFICKKCGLRKDGDPVRGTLIEF